MILPGKKQSICVLKLDSSYPSVQKIECLVADNLIKEKVCCCMRNRNFMLDKSFKTIV